MTILGINLVEGAVPCGKEHSKQAAAPVVTIRRRLKHRVLCGHCIHFSESSSQWYAVT